MHFINELEKGNKKHICPKCLKKTFVRYVNKETEEYLDNEFGRCDRESKCGYFSYPSVSIQNSIKIKTKSTPQISYHSPGLIESSSRNYRDNNFISFLKTSFSENQIKRVITKYLIGTSKHWNGATVFWQIDQNEKIRHGKIMLYDSFTGKRLKRESGGAYISSVRAVLKLNNFNLSQCLFGLHLINEIDDSKVAIVESEKTAIIMSLFKPEYIWMATGSKNGLKYEYLKPLRNKEIIVFPDKSEYYDWLDKTNELNKIGFNILVSQYLENSNFPIGTDLADVYFENYKNASSLNSLKKITSMTERKVNDWSTFKPEIWKLIEDFDLIDKNGDSIERSDKIK